ncbi:hypothetical protein HYR99_29235 [Candidatus Poribacteria bacterium]|nr:hypothetical protein [Candidatus Poribacteria bacterium]
MLFGLRQYGTGSGKGKKFEAYQEQLIEDVAQDERTQIYLDILSELEEEGKDRMADEVILKLIDRMPPERFERLLLNLPVEKLLRTLSRLPAEQLQKALTTFPTEQLQVLLAGIPKEQLQQALARTSGGTTSND